MQAPGSIGHSDAHTCCKGALWCGHLVWGSSILVTDNVKIWYSYPLWYQSTPIRMFCLYFFSFLNFLIFFKIAIDIFSSIYKQEGEEKWKDQHFVFQECKLMQSWSAHTKKSCYHCINLFLQIPMKGKGRRFYTFFFCYSKPVKCKVIKDLVTLSRPNWLLRELKLRVAHKISGLLELTARQ